MTPLIIVTLVLVWQFVLLGYTYTLAGNAADEAVRAATAARAGGAGGGVPAGGTDKLPGAWQAAPTVSCGGERLRRRPTSRCTSPSSSRADRPSRSPVRGHAGAVEEGTATEMRRTEARGSGRGRRGRDRGAVGPGPHRTGATGARRPSSTWASSRSCSLVALAAVQLGLIAYAAQQAGTAARAGARSASLRRGLRREDCARARQRLAGRRLRARVRAATRSRRHRPPSTIPSVIPGVGDFDGPTVDRHACRVDHCPRDERSRP